MIGVSNDVTKMKNTNTARYDNLARTVNFFRSLIYYFVLKLIFLIPYLKFLASYRSQFNRKITSSFWQRHSVLVVQYLIPLITFIVFYPLKIQEHKDYVHKDKNPRTQFFYILQSSCAAVYLRSSLVRDLPCDCIYLRSTFVVLAFEPLSRDWNIAAWNKSEIDRSAHQWPVKLPVRPHFPKKLTPTRISTVHPERQCRTDMPSRRRWRSSLLFAPSQRVQRGNICRFAPRGVMRALAEKGR